MRNICTSTSTKYTCIERNVLKIKLVKLVKLLVKLENCCNYSLSTKHMQNANFKIYNYFEHTVVGEQLSFKMQDRVLK